LNTHIAVHIHSAGFNQAVCRCFDVAAVVFFSCSVYQPQVQPASGLLADPPARRWLPGQQAPQSDRGAVALWPHDPTHFSHAYEPPFVLSFD